MSPDFVPVQHLPKPIPQMLTWSSVSLTQELLPHRDSRLNPEFLLDWHSIKTAM